MTCQTCNGAGHMPGRWMPEPCPNCGGESEADELRQMEPASVVKLIVALAASVAVSVAAFVGIGYLILAVLA